MEGGGVEVEERASVKQCRKLLYRSMRIGVADGRIFVGKFHCLDKQGNIILYDTLEQRQGAGTEPRSLGLVLIPTHCRVSCHVECSLGENLSGLSLN
ncbi:N-alpha-acetyltransferase 38, NatC auxiliary subunit-like [Selaginella moellendorffii]|uniref:N-alpha-acetyltransferase 38, NatC auxiliary subunit-like n=1 Tax=Selaginella moellendorffii TaxID=88036 RepID=UPI000D1C7BA6|nr:N-alpha-acetyltransferase 38, NatC auxiliary subunit-like [Selaginella moellendorffii]|eukprot:XP_024542349.1 N-alpha-acetyltransferase 38, NatC auxiliary subunit-like [Selaginella moellendorffii]